MLIISAVSAVKTRTETIWKLVDESGGMRIAFVNKMDKEMSGFLRAVDTWKRHNR
ncbi:MAG: hypothetical protein HY887_10000 [Deltaproteobacteria bacterium]|nr:hypothetical protein [Deltaproteobacteria bacterium]